MIAKDMQLRQAKYLNNIIEQDHRFTKKCLYSMLGFKFLRIVKWIIAGIETIHMIKIVGFARSPIRERKAKNDLVFYKKKIILYRMKKG